MSASATVAPPLELVPGQLTILTTSTCTARCAHCSVSSSPHRRDRLSFENIRDTIDRLHGHSPLRVVIFAGGEPTLLRDDLLDAIAHADALGILTRIVTNAYWARTEERARAKLVELREAGLQELNVSADDYHLPFIPFDNVVNVFRASKGLGFRAVVIATCSGPRTKVTPEYVMERLGEPLALRFDDDGRSTPLPPPSPDGTLYALSNAHVQRIGRGDVQLDDGEFWDADDEASFDGPCPWAIRCATLSPQGHLVACCGIEAEGNEVLDFGDATTTDELELLRRANDDVIVRAITTLGPVFLKRYVELRAPHIPMPPRFSMCATCEQVVGRLEVVAVLRENVAELAGLVLAAQDMIESQAAGAGAG